jgi:hypothetical protein
MRFLLMRTIYMLCRASKLPFTHQNDLIFVLLPPQRSILLEANAIALSPKNTRHGTRGVKYP